MLLQIVGRGRMGGALAHALTAVPDGAVVGHAREATWESKAGGSAPGFDVLPLAGRGADGTGPDGTPVDVVLLAVPDAEIAAAAAAIVPGPIIGHCSGATGLDVLGDRPAFSMHPLLTLLGAGTSFAGAYAAIAASEGADAQWGAIRASEPADTTDRDPLRAHRGEAGRALDVAERLAAALGMRTFQVHDADRALYHAAASVASNFLVTVEGFAEQLASAAGVPRAALVPLADAALRNWAAHGAETALTGPIVRGDEATVERQRAAVADRAPEQLELFDALVSATRTLAAPPS